MRYDRAGDIFIMPDPQPLQEIGPYFILAWNIDKHRCAVAGTDRTALWEQLRARCPNAMFATCYEVNEALYKACQDPSLSTDEFWSRFNQESYRRLIADEAVERYKRQVDLSHGAAMMVFVIWVVATATIAGFAVCLLPAWALGPGFIGWLVLSPLLCLPLYERLKKP